MNDADSKKLEEIKGYRQAIGNTTNDEFNWLISKIKEQDREIERRESTRGAMNAQVLRWEKLYNHQRRHREWALKQCRIWQRHFCFYKDDAVRFHSDRADKAEAELSACKERVKILQVILREAKDAYIEHEEWFEEEYGENRSKEAIAFIREMNKALEAQEQSKEAAG